MEDYEMTTETPESNSGGLSAKFANLKTKSKVLIGIFAPMVLLVVLGTVAIVDIKSIVNTNERVDHTRIALADAAAIIGSAVDMETCMRGYLLAGKEGFLDPYKSGQKATYEQTEALKKVVSDNPGQIARLVEVEKTLHAWQKNATEPTIALRREIGDAKTMQDMAHLIAEARGKVFFDKFRGQVATFIEREQVLLTEREVKFSKLLDSGVTVQSNVAKDTIERVTHNYKVIAEANAILSAAVDMETGMRGYLLAGLGEFFAPYTHGTKVFHELTTDLEKVISDNPAQVKLLGEMRSTIDNWVEQVTTPTIALLREIGDAKTMHDMAHQVAKAEGKVYFDGFRQIMADFSAEEQGLMTARQAENEETVSSTYMVIAACMAFALAIGGALA